jgi:ribosomal protein S18 acetylase RimI-like enzyme
MLIRPATPDDVPAVVPMVEKLAAFLAEGDRAKYEPLPEIGDMYRRWLRERAGDPRSVFLVAERQPGLVVGFLIGTVEREIPIYRLTEYGFIHDVWIEPDYRNEGIARQLVTLAIERFRAIGVRQVRLDVLAGNDAARNLFSTCGLRPSIIEMLVELPSTTRDSGEKDD